MFRFLSALSQLNVDTSSEVSVFKVVFVQILDKVEKFVLQATVWSDTIYMQGKSISLISFIRSFYLQFNQTENLLNQQ